MRRSSQAIVVAPSEARTRRSPADPADIAGKKRQVSLTFSHICPRHICDARCRCLLRACTQWNGIETPRNPKSIHYRAGKIAQRWAVLSFQRHAAAP